MKVELKKLRDLEIGDKFYPLSQHGKKDLAIYTVIGKPEFNYRHGSPTRKCKQTGQPRSESKSCRMEVMKICKTWQSIDPT